MSPNPPTAMADVMDPQAVEEQSQAEQDNYKVYKRRWLVLFAMFSVILNVGLHRSIISIANIIEEYVNKHEHDYEILEQVSMYTTMVSVLGMARALDYFGLRRMSYIACIMILCANTLKALCFTPASFVSPWVVNNRYNILLLSEAFVGFAQSISVCIPAKVASAWFAHYESTLALVIANCGFNIGVGFSNYFTPVFIKNVGDVYKLSYLFILSGCLVTFIVLTCVTRSSPKMPPSSNAIVSASNMIPLKSGISVMLSTPSYVLVLVTLALNLSASNVEQLVLDEILIASKYENSFCGTLIAHSYFFGTFFMLMGAAWVDNSANFVRVSRISSIMCALSISTFNISIILPNIKNVIIVTNVMASFGTSIMYPALIQVSLRSAVSILPEATVSAIVIVSQQLISGLLINLLEPLRSFSPKMGYEAPMLLFACVLMVVNILYVSSFRAPSRDYLQSKLRLDDEEDNDRRVIVDPQDSYENQKQEDDDISQKQQEPQSSNGAII